MLVVVLLHIAVWSEVSQRQRPLCCVTSFEGHNRNHFRGMQMKDFANSYHDHYFFSHLVFVLFQASTIINWLICKNLRLQMHRGRGKWLTPRHRLLFVPLGHLRNSIQTFVSDSCHVLIISLCQLCLPQTITGKCTEWQKGQWVSCISNISCCLNSVTCTHSKS